MVDDFLSLTELGQIYGVTRNKVGCWLVDLGLRTKEKKPSKVAFDGGFVEQRLSTQPGTCKALNEAGYIKSNPPEEVRLENHPAADPLATM